MINTFFCTLKVKLLFIEIHLKESTNIIQNLGKIFVIYVMGKGLASRIYEGHQRIKNKEKYPNRKIDKIYKQAFTERKHK